MPIVDRIGDPTMLLGDVAEVNAAMVVRNVATVAPLCRLTNEFDRLARPQVIAGIAAAVNARSRFPPELIYPARIRLRRAEQIQRLRPSLL
jgi:hypothetical protein